MYRWGGVVSAIGGVMPVRVFSTMSLLRRFARNAVFIDARVSVGVRVLHDDKTRLREFEHAVLAVIAAEARAFPACVEALVRIGGRAVHIQFTGFDLVGHAHCRAIV